MPHICVKFDLNRISCSKFDTTLQRCFSNLAEPFVSESVSDILLPIYFDFVLILVTICNTIWLKGVTKMCTFSYKSLTKFSVTKLDQMSRIHRYKVAKLLQHVCLVI